MQKGPGTLFRYRGLFFFPPAYCPTPGSGSGAAFFSAMPGRGSAIGAELYLSRLLPSSPGRRGTVEMPFAQGVSESPFSAYPAAR